MQVGEIATARELLEERREPPPHAANRRSVEVHQQSLGDDNRAPLRIQQLLTDTNETFRALVLEGVDADDVVIRVLCAGFGQHGSFASDHLGQGLFLHFTLHLTGTTKLFEGRKWLILYLPAALAGVLSLGIVALPMESAISKLLRQGFWLLIAFMMVYDLLVLATLVNRAVRPRQDGPSRKDLVLILSAFAVVALVSFLPSVGLTPQGGDDFVNFVYVLIPLAYTVVIVKYAKRHPSSHTNA